MNNRKTKILAYCDTPSCATGFGTVSRNVLSGLYNTGKYDIDILGINYFGDPHEFPFRIWPTAINSERDPYGRNKVFNQIHHMDFDLLFFMQDTFILEFLPKLQNSLKMQGKDFKSIVYFPIDGKPKEQWAINVEACDYVVTYSEYGKKQVIDVLPRLEDRLISIPHGTNTKDFFHIPKDKVANVRKQFFGNHHDKFIFANFNRNQQRKDIPRTIAAFYEFRKQVPDSMLYLHMAKQDQGWDLPQVVEQYGMNIRDDVVFPENFGPNQGFPLDVVNYLYNCVDCVISTTLGEGWGLTWGEAMATKTPIIVPNNTALTENVTEDRGWLSNSGSNPSLFTVVPSDNEVVRPLVDVDDMVKKMLEVYNGGSGVDKRVENAYNWVVNEMDWHKNIVPMWEKVFENALEDLITKKTDKVGDKDNNIIEAESF